MFISSSTVKSHVRRDALITDDKNGQGVITIDYNMEVILMHRIGKILTFFVRFQFDFCFIHIYYY